MQFRSSLYSRIRQLKLLNSNHTCYLNAFVLLWLRAHRQVVRNMLRLGPCSSICASFSATCRSHSSTAKENNWLKDGKWQHRGPFMVNRVHASRRRTTKWWPSNWGSPTELRDVRMRGRFWRSSEALSTSIDWRPAEARLPSTVAGRGCSSEALSRIRQLKLLNSNHTCYLNAFALLWLRAHREVVRNMLRLGPDLRPGVMFLLRKTTSCTCASVLARYP